LTGGASLLAQAAEVLRRLEPYAPGAARRAHQALAVVVGRLEREDGVAHRSRLTGDGYPLEFGFSTLDPAIRYTCETARAEIPPERRLAVAERVLGDLGRRGRFPLHRLQDGGPLEYGAWLGGRHSDAADSYKLYVEVPAGLSPPAHRALSRLLGDRKTLLESQVFRLRMIGWDVGSGRFELYFRGRALAPLDLARLLRLSDLEGLEDRLLELIAEASGRGVTSRLPGSQHGFSLALMPAERISHFSFFLFARSCFGTDAVTRARLLELADRNGWDMRPYAAASEPLASQDGPACRHGVVAFVISRERRCGVQIGLRPPSVPA
jgi:hypothetical protein